MAWYYAHILEASAAGLALLFAILALSTESWMQVRFDMVQPPPTPYYSFCADPQAADPATCFGLPSCLPTTAEISISILRTLNLYVSPIDITKIIPPEPTPYYDACMVSIMALPRNDRNLILDAVKDGRLFVNASSGVFIPTHSLMPNKTDDGVYTGVAVHIGLFNLCAESRMPFDPRLADDESSDCRTDFSTTVCVSTSEVCNYLVSNCFEDLNVTVRQRQEDIKADAVPLCKRVLAVAILQCFTLAAAVVALASAIYAAVRFDRDGIEEPRTWPERVPIFVVFIFQLCAVAVWGSLYSHGQGLLDWFFPDGQPFWVLPPNDTVNAKAATSLSQWPFPSYSTIQDVTPNLSYSFAFGCVSLVLTGVSIVFLLSRRRSVVVGRESLIRRTKYGALPISETEAEQRAVSPRRG